MTKNSFVVALAVFGWILWSARSDAQDALFAPASPVTVGRGSGEVLLADLDRDGHLDLFTRHLLTRSAAVRLGDGTGRFAASAATVLHFDYGVGAAALGDVNADGVLDLAVTSRDRRREYVHILLGTARGGFDQGSASRLVAGAASRSSGDYKPIVRLVDVNEDGKLDVVYANAQHNTLEILFGDGRGGFSPPEVVVLGVERAYYTSALGDVDGDGHLDVVAVSNGWSGSGPGRVLTKRGDGRGAFADAAGPPVTVLSAPRLVALADVNGDGRADVVLAHSRSNLLSVLLSDGNGRFTPARGSPMNVGMEAWAAAVTDVDRDGKADLVVSTVSGAAPWSSRVVVLLGDGRGFVPAPGSPFPVGPGAYFLAVGDVNEDGRPDIAAASFEGDAVTVLLGRALATPRP